MAKPFKRLPKELQDAIVKAGKEAGAYGRQIESSEDQAKLDKMVEEGKIKVHPFTEREKLLELAEPVKKAYAEEIGASAVLERINAIQ